ncbi:MAG: hypothetical protein WKF93_04185 [Acidimicrobiales bacterium]
MDRYRGVAHLVQEGVVGEQPTRVGGRKRGEGLALDEGVERLAVERDVAAQGDLEETVDAGEREAGLGIVAAVEALQFPLLLGQRRLDPVADAVEQHGALQQEPDDDGPGQEADEPAEDA